MKTILALLSSIALLADTASAIPQRVSNGGFFGAVGMAFEQYVATVAVWSPGAELKGPWKPSDKPAKAAGVETLVLGTDALVFGIAAAQVSVERVNGAARRFTVLFTEGKTKDGKPSAGGLYDRVLANITALAGDAKSVSASGERTFRHEAALITARKSGGKEVIVEFTPAQ